MNRHLHIVIVQGKDVLSLSTANGNDIAFLLPSLGQTNVYVEGPGIAANPQANAIMGAQIGHLNA